MVKTLGMRLRANGFQIITAHDGAMAIALAQHEKPDLIVLDIKMSGKNGYSLFQDLRESVSARSIPIVFFSALPSEQAQEKATQLGPMASFQNQPTQTKYLPRSRKSSTNRKASR